MNAPQVGQWVDVRFRGRIVAIKDDPRTPRLAIEVENVGMYVEAVPADVCSPVRTAATG